MRSSWLCGLPIALACSVPSLLAAQDDDPLGTLFGERQGEDEEQALPEDPLARARALWSRGRLSEAEDALRRLLAAAKASPATEELLARLLLRTGRLAEAEALARRRIERSPTDPVGHLVAGRVAELRGDLAEARARYEAATTLAEGDEESPLALECPLRRAELEWEIDAEVAERVLARILRLYQRRDELSAREFVWVARACRLAAYFPRLKARFARGMREYARKMLDQALASDPSLATAHVEAGLLALDTYNLPLAKKSFRRALERDPNDPSARVGLARALLSSFGQDGGTFGDAAANLQKALSVDPGYAPAHALLAAKDVTDGDLAGALERLSTGLRERPGDVELLAVKAAIHLLRGDEHAFEGVAKAVLATRPRCGRFYLEVARLVELKFRYAEARDLARRALAVNPGYFPALAVLGVNLTRTGEEDEGRRVLRKAFDEDPYDVYVFNHLQLWDRVEEQYEVVEAPGFLLRVHRDELRVTPHYALELLARAKARFEKEYGPLPERVLVEIFPQHADFSARSVGLPGIPALGVCFGNVVTVLSAREKRAVGAHSWGRTLWHEFAHVASLTATRNRISRWFSEGLSVYEEARGHPTWRREYDAEIITLLRRGLLLPIARLDEGFTKPKYPSQVMMSYYQAGMTCEFIAARWGSGKLRELLGAYRAGKDTAQGIREVFGIAPAAFDARFRAFLEERYAHVAWRPPPSLDERRALLAQVERSPWDVAARGALALAYALHGQPSDAEAHAGLALRHAALAAEEWPLLVELEVPWALPGAEALRIARAAAARAGAADAHLALSLVAQRRGKLARALRRARRALRLGTRDPVRALEVVGTVHRLRKRWREAIAAYEAAARLSPPRADTHRFLHACRKAAGDEEGAMQELRAVCLLDSDDAKARMDYAEWAAARGRWAEVAEVLDDINMIDPFLPRAHLLLADGLRRTALGKVDALERALREYSFALELKVDYRAGALFGQAACLEALGRDRARAIELAKAALRDDPEHAEARDLLERLEAQAPHTPERR